jgi:hypothetical protein
MPSDPALDATLARRYLLGEAGDEERERVERAYFADEMMLGRMEAAEESLIEDYLADRLSADSRSRFEREFLAVPHRRARVETIRLLSAAAARARPATGPKAVAATRRPAMSTMSLAAAALVLIAAGTWWAVGAFRAGRPSASDAVARSGGDVPLLHEPVRVFAVSLSPAATRSADTTPDVIVPAGTEVVELRLAAEPGDAPVEHGRALVRTVSGDEVWSGPATSQADRSAGIAASIAVPAPRLGPDDYVITLLAASPGGAEREASRYFMRIVAR